MSLCPVCEGGGSEDRGGNGGTQAGNKTRCEQRVWPYDPLCRRSWPHLVFHRCAWAFPCVHLV
eukprot:10642200-Ditylum_brightwellii.AAC.1